MYSQITAAGQALLDASSGPVELTRYELGSSFGYTLDSNPTGLHGNVVYSNVPAKLKSDGPQILRTGVFLGYEVGSFSFGEIAAGILNIDAYAVALNDLVLVKDQASTFQNGIYQVTTLGTAGVPFALTRIDGMDSSNEFGGALVAVQNKGATTANSLWMCGAPETIVVGTTAVTFTQLNTPYTLTATNGVQISASVASILLQASSGLQTSAAGLGIDTSVVVRKYAVAVPAGAVLPVITHNLNTLDVTVAVYEVATGDEVLCDVTHTSVNTITLGFAIATTANQYRVVVHG